MDLEPNNLQNEVVEEIDVFLRVPKNDLYLVQYPLRPHQIGFSRFETIQEVKGKPLQKQFNMTVALSSECDNFNPEKGETKKYTLESKIVHNRTNYCVGKIENGQLILIPVSNCLQLRKSFHDIENKFKDPKKLKEEAKEEAKPQEHNIQEINTQIKRKENLKQIERKIRSYPFQREVLNSEEYVPLNYFERESVESRRIVNSLLDPPTEFKVAKPRSRSEYAESLF